MTLELRSSSYNTWPLNFWIAALRHSRAWVLGQGDSLSRILALSATFRKCEHNYAISCLFQYFFVVVSARDSWPHSLTRPVLCDRVGWCMQAAQTSGVSMSSFFALSLLLQTDDFTLCNVALVHLILLEDKFMSWSHLIGVVYILVTAAGSVIQSHWVPPAWKQSLVTNTIPFLVDTTCKLSNYQSWKVWSGLRYNGMGEVCVCVCCIVELVFVFTFFFYLMCIVLDWQRVCNQLLHPFYAAGTRMQPVSLQKITIFCKLTGRIWVPLLLSHHYYTWYPASFVF